MAKGFLFDASRCVGCYACVAACKDHREADVNLLIEPDYLDPISGFPGFKSSLCEVREA